MVESRFQHELIDEIRDRFPGVIVLKNDPNYIQGFPDLLILWNERWAALECKRSEHSTHRPNQDYYVKLLDQMSFASFVYPENKEDVLYDMEQSFKRSPRRRSRVPRSL